MRPLTTVGNVASEQARLYRMVANNKIDSGEGSRRTFMLTQLRASLEAVEANTPVASAAPLVVSVSITPIMSGTYLTSADVARIARHEPTQDLIPADQATLPPEPVDSASGSSPDTVVNFPVVRRLEPDDDLPGAA